MISYVMPKAAMISVEINGVLIPFVWVENLPCWLKASNGRYIEEYRSGGAFPKI